MTNCLQNQIKVVIDVILSNGLIDRWLALSGTAMSSKKNADFLPPPGLIEISPSRFKQSRNSILIDAFYCWCAAGGQICETVSQMLWTKIEEAPTKPYIMQCRILGRGPEGPKFGQRLVQNIQESKEQKISNSVSVLLDSVSLISTLVILILFSYCYFYNVLIANELNQLQVAKNCSQKAWKAILETTYLKISWRNIPSDPTRSSHCDRCHVGGGGGGGGPQAPQRPNPLERWCLQRHKRRLRHRKSHSLPTKQLESSVSPVLAIVCTKNIAKVT